MDHRNNRPVGEVVAFTRPPAPPADIRTDWVHLLPVNPARDAPALFAACAGADWIWDYMGYGPFADQGAMQGWLDGLTASDDPHFYAITAGDGVAQGLASFLRIDRPNGVIEVGHILMPPVLQRSRTASAAIMAMIGWAFGAGYRRVEWKCNDLNAPSRRAALRYGFTYEGTFRRNMIIKGRNRDTAWYAITDAEWPGIRAAYDAWLAPGNFDAEGRQRAPLSVPSHDGGG